MRNKVKLPHDMHILKGHIKSTLNGVKENIVYTEGRKNDPPMINGAFKEKARNQTDFGSKKNGRQR